MIGEHVTGATGDRHNPDSGAGQPAEVSRGARGEDQVLDRVHPDHAQVVQQFVDRVVVAGHGPRVRGGHPCGQLGPAGFQHHDGFAGQCGAVGGGREDSRVPDRLQEQGDGLGVLVAGQIVEHVARGDHGFVAERHQVGRAHTGHRGEVEHRAGAHPALGYQGHRPGRVRQAGDRGDRDLVDEVGEPQVVGAGQQDAQRFGVGDQVRLGPLPGRAGVRVPGGQHQRVPDARRGRVGERVESACPRHHRERDVDGLGDLGARGDGGPPVRRRAAAVHQVGVLAQAELDQVAERHLGEARLVRGADQRDAARPQQRPEALRSDQGGHVVTCRP